MTGPGSTVDSGRVNVREFDVIAVTRFATLYPANHRVRHRQQENFQHRFVDVPDEYVVEELSTLIFTKT